jgi:hypothetical protein
LNRRARLLQRGRAVFIASPSGAQALVWTGLNRRGKQLTRQENDMAILQQVPVNSSLGINVP